MVRVLTLPDYLACAAILLRSVERAQLPTGSWPRRGTCVENLGQHPFAPLQTVSTFVVTGKASPVISERPRATGNNHEDVSQAFFRGIVPVERACAGVDAKAQAVQPMSRKTWYSHLFPLCTSRVSFSCLPLFPTCLSSQSSHNNIFEGAAFKTAAPRLTQTEAGIVSCLGQQHWPAVDAHRCLASY